MVALELVRHIVADTPVAKIHTPTVVWSGLIPQLILMVGGVVMLTIVSLVKGRLPRGSYAIYTVAVAGASLIATIPLARRVLEPLLIGSQTIPMIVLAPNFQ